MDLIYCAGGNPRLSRIAVEHGFLYGSRSDKNPDYPIVFADLDWKHLDLGRHLDFVRKHHPRYAVAPDIIEWPYPLWDYVDQLQLYAECVIIVPKVHGIIQEIPDEFIIGYSVPTKYGGTYVFATEFAGRRIHLLGGSPHKQIRIYHQLAGVSKVVSADGNMMNRMAIHLRFWRPGTAYYKSQWCTLKEANDGIPVEGVDLYVEAFRRSCQNIMAAWQQLLGEDAINQPTRSIGH